MVRESVRHTATDRRLGRLPSGAAVTVTVHRYVGGTGPTVYVQAAQHGIELNGPAALRRLHGRLLDADLAGTVVVVPVVNRLAFDHRSYMTPGAYDAVNPNLNRVWPGAEDGSLQQRLVARLWELVSDADAAVDLHTGTADMLEHVRVGEGASAARTLAEAFGTEVVLLEESQAAADDATTGGTAATSDDRDGTDPEAGVAGHEPRTPTTGGKFRTVATRAGIPAVTAELSNSRRVARPAAETGVEGVCNVLRSLDVMGGPPRRPETQTLLCADAPPTLATESGLFEPRPDLAVGEAVEGGAPVGALYDPSSFDRLETVTAEAGGTVYSITRESVVVAGERLVAVASRE